MGEIKAICISDRKGIQKHVVPEALFVEDYGIDGDAHAGKWHRQVSLLSWNKIEDFRARGAVVDYGAFGENLVVEGLDFKALPVGTLFACGDVLLEMTQIGKECHTHCAIHKAVGDCIMPREGVFCKVLRGGKVRLGDELKIVGQNRRFRTAVLTLSDKASVGQREDESGPLIRELVERENYLVVDRRIIADEQELIERTLIQLCDEIKVDLILTTGGTGFSVRDRTPEATLAVAERGVPGIAEAMRAHSMKITNKAMLSRAVSVIRGATLIINLPGSSKAVKESLECVLPALEHGLEILKGTASECGRS